MAKVITVDVSGLDVIDSSLQEMPKYINRAKLSALRKSAKHARTLLDKGIRNYLAVKQKASLKRIKVIPDSDGMIVRFSRKPYRLANFSHRLFKYRSDTGRKSRSVAVKTKKSGGYEKLKGTFIIGFPNGHEGIFERSKRYEAKRGSSLTLRSDMIQRYGPTPLSAFENNDQMRNKVMSDIKDDLVKKAESQIDRFLKGAK